MLLRVALRAQAPPSRCIMDPEDELSKRARRRPRSCTERSLLASKLSVERVMRRTKVQYRLLMRALEDLERERREEEEAVKKEKENEN